jgi:hypothetical protein
MTLVCVYIRCLQYFKVEPADRDPDGNLLETAKSVLVSSGDSQSSVIDDMIAAGNQEGLYNFYFGVALQFSQNHLSCFCTILPILCWCAVQSNKQTN